MFKYTDSRTEKHTVENLVLTNNVNKAVKAFHRVCEGVARLKPFSKINSYLSFLNPKPSIVTHERNTNTETDHRKLKDEANVW